MTLAGILLAAGASTRMGFPKQLLEIEGVTLIRRAADSLLATGCCPAVVVLGASADRISPQLANLPVITVVNPDWNNGMASSIRSGLDAAREQHPQIDAILITLCDQPRVTADDLIALIGLHSKSGKPIAAAAYGDTVGVPAIFASTMFSALLALDGEAGARKVISENLHNVAQLPLPSAALDVDRKSDLAAAGITPDAFD